MILLCKKDPTIWSTLWAKLYNLWCTIFRAPTATVKQAPAKLSKVALKWNTAYTPQQVLQQGDALMAEGIYQTCLGAPILLVQREYDQLRLLQNTYELYEYWEYNITT